MDRTEPNPRKAGWQNSRRLLAGCLAVAILVALLSLFNRTRRVAVAHPQRVAMAESIASSARVGGVQESALGAQFSGTVEHLYVKEGDRVQAGQRIATLKNDVTQQQKTQARAALETARARLAQASRAALPTELDQAEHQVREARSLLGQANSDLTLAEKQYQRSRQLYEQGLVAKAEFDSAQANNDSLEARARSARATVKARQAALETLKAGPRPEDVEVARAQAAEAEQALKVADQQQREANISAPFTGVVTALHAQEGQSVGAEGVVSLVSDDLEIRVDLDESNLADLELGQRAVLSSTAYGGKQFEGKLTDIGAAVNEARGIVTVKVTADDPPPWLRPGQTVNVNLVTNEDIDRLVVPASAVVRQGNRTVVRVVEDGHVQEKQVLTRPAAQQGIPVASGLMESDEVVIDGASVKPGQPVRIRREER